MEREKTREFSTEREMSEAGAAAPPPVPGRETGSAAPSDIAKDVGARRQSQATAGHDAGSGANETLDGLTSSEEAMRRGAEDTPIGAPELELEDVPVFDRADALPKT